MKRILLIAGIVIGAIIALGPVWGTLGVAWGMQRAFDALQKSGISDPRVLSSKIGTVLLIQTLGLVACPVGLALCIFCIIKFQAIYRRPPPLPESPGRESQRPNQ